MAFALFKVKSLWVYEACMVVILFALGLIFSTTNTLAMNEGRAQAGEASSLLGISGYVVGAVASPLVGLGNIMHSTAVVYLVLAVLVSAFALVSKRMTPDPDMK